MKKLTLLACAAVLLATTGCGGQAESGTAAPATSAAAAPAATPTPTAEPTPEVLTDEEASEVFLAGVCPRNTAVYKLSDMLEAAWVSDQGFYDTANLDLKKLKKLAAKQRDADRAAAEANEEALWPKDMRKTVEKYTDGLYLEMTWLNAMIDASNVDNFLADYAAAPNMEKTAAAAQKIRAKLGVSADPKESCKDH